MLPLHSPRIQSPSSPFDRTLVQHSPSASSSYLQPLSRPALIPAFEHVPNRRSAQLHLHLGLKGFAPATDHFSPLPYLPSAMSYTLKDRTNEFRACVESASLRASASNEARRPLLNTRDDKKGQRSEFARMAAKIGKDIQGTTFKLEKLAQRQSRLVSDGALLQC